MVHIFGKGLSKALERDKLEANFGHFQHTVNPGKSNALSLSTLVVTGVFYFCASLGSNWN